MVMSSLFFRCHSRTKWVVETPPRRPSKIRPTRSDCFLMIWFSPYIVVIQNRTSFSRFDERKFRSAIFRWFINRNDTAVAFSFLNNNMKWIFILKWCHKVDLFYRERVLSAFVFLNTSYPRKSCRLVETGGWASNDRCSFQGSYNPIFRNAEVFSAKICHVAACCLSSHLEPSTMAVKSDHEQGQANVGFHIWLHPYSHRTSHGVLWGREKMPSRREKRRWRTRFSGIERRVRASGEWRARFDRSNRGHYGSRRKRLSKSVYTNIGPQGRNCRGIKTKSNVPSLAFGEDRWSAILAKLFYGPWWLGAEVETARWVFGSQREPCTETKWNTASTTILIIKYYGEMRWWKLTWIFFWLKWNANDSSGQRWREENFGVLRRRIHFKTLGLNLGFVF